MTGKEFLDTLAASLTTLLSNLMERVFGPGVLTPRFGNVSWADFGVLLCFVLLVLWVNGLVASFLRRKIRQAEAQPESKEWRTQLWQTVGRPFYLLIWVCGTYLAATPVLLKLASAQGPHPVRQLFDKLFDVGVFVVLFWLFFKFTHVLEARLKTWAAKTSSQLGELIVPLLGRSLRVVVPVVGLVLALPIIGLSPESAGVLAKGSSILIVAAVAYVLFQAVGLGEKAVLARYDIKAADILGSVFVWADYTLPIAELRPAVEQIVKECRDWDRRFWNLQMTDTTDRAMQLRVLATAADASKAWDLRCAIREGLLAFLQEHHVQSLPKVRAAIIPLQNPAAAGVPAVPGS